MKKKISVFLVLMLSLTLSNDVNGKNIKKDSIIKSSNTEESIFPIKYMKEIEKFSVSEKSGKFYFRNKEVTEGILKKESGDNIILSYKNNQETYENYYQKIGDKNIHKKVVIKENENNTIIDKDTVETTLNFNYDKNNGKVGTDLIAGNYTNNYSIRTLLINTIENNKNTSLIVFTYPNNATKLVHYIGNDGYDIKGSQKILNGTEKIIRDKSLFVKQTQFRGYNEKKPKKRSVYIEDNYKVKTDDVSIQKYVVNSRKWIDYDDNGVLIYYSVSKNCIEGCEYVLYRKEVEYHKNYKLKKVKISHENKKQEYIDLSVSKYNKKGIIQSKSVNYYKKGEIVNKNVFYKYNSNGKLKLGSYKVEKKYNNKKQVTSLKKMKYRSNLKKLSLKTRTYKGKKVVVQVNYNYNKKGNIYGNASKIIINFKKNGKINSAKKALYNKNGKLGKYHKIKVSKKILSMK